VAKGKPKSEAVKPQTQPDTVDLTGSGLFVRRARDSSFTVSRRLGGAVAVCRPEAMPLYHLGYEVVTEDGKRYSSAAWDTGASISDMGGGDTLSTAAAFRAVSSGVPLKYLMVPFQSATHLLLHGRLSEAFQQAIKRRMVSPDAELQLRLSRTIRFTKDGIEVEDVLEPQPEFGKIASVHVASEISMHSPSARQDPARTIEFPSGTCETIAARLNAGQSVSIGWSCSYDGTLGTVTTGEPGTAA